MGGRESESWAMRSQDLIFRKLFAVKESERRSSFPNVCVALIVRASEFELLT